MTKKNQTSRRQFLNNVGSGMLVAGLGSQLAVELGVASEQDLQEPAKASYEGLSVWVSRMQDCLLYTSDAADE